MKMIKERKKKKMKMIKRNLLVALMEVEEVQRSQIPLKVERAQMIQVNLKISEEKKVAAPSIAKTVANFTMKKDL